MNSYLFIIPLTPASFLNEERLALQKLCFSALNIQNYKNWKALIIGGHLPLEFEHNEHYIFINYEAKKEEKLQIATQYLIENNLNFDYLIRLDDDDIFNPFLLMDLANKEFNIYVDQKHWFWYPEKNYVANDLRHWLPNSVIIKKDIAYTPFGEFPPGNHKNIAKKCMLIHNEHHVIHEFFLKKKIHVTFAPKNKPIYLRSISNSSITSNISNNSISYFLSFGFWKKNYLADFSFLKPLVVSNKHDKNIIINNQFSYKRIFDLFKKQIKLFQFINKFDR